MTFLIMFTTTYENGNPFAERQCVKTLAITAMEGAGLASKEPSTQFRPSADSRVPTGPETA